MPDAGAPPARVIGTLADAEGRQVTVGISGSTVTLRTYGTAELEART